MGIHVLAAVEDFERLRQTEWYMDILEYAVNIAQNNRNSNLSFFHTRDNDRTINGVLLGTQPTLNTSRPFNVTHLDVAPDHQGNGIGSALLKHFLGLSEHRSATTRIRVKTSNHRAIQLYNRFNFAVNKNLSSMANNSLVMDRQPNFDF